MFITDAYARILCKECKKEVAILKPGQPFKEVAQCECQVKVEPKKVIRKKAE